MTFTPEQRAALSAPLHAQHVRSRSQAGRTLSYVEAWHAIAEANRIFGYDGWHRETIETRCVSEKERKIGQQGKDGWSVSYIAKVRVEVDAHGGTLVREGTGAGHGIDVDLGLAHESAIKEAESDAMKRALMTFGNPFGLALYDKTQAQVTTARATPSTAGVITGRQLLEQQEGDVPGRKSSAQAKRDGDHDRINGMIDNANPAALRELHETFDQWTAEVPLAWVDPIRNRMQLRLEELNGAANVADQAADMDAAFRGTMGDRGSTAVAGSRGERQAAHA